MATNTANGKYSYEDTFNEITLGEWVNLNHKENCKLNNWSYTPLRPGAFGFDNIACSLIWFFNVYDNTDDSHSLAEAVHNGWIENYLYWRDNKPWMTNPNYFKPAKAIGRHPTQYVRDYAFRQSSGRWKGKRYDFRKFYETESLLVSKLNSDLQLN